MGKTKPSPMAPPKWKPLYTHLPIKKRYTMALRTNIMQNYSGKWNVKLNNTIVASVIVKKKDVDIKTTRGIQSFFLETHPGDAKSMILTSNVMMKKKAFWNAEFVNANELKWTMAENESVSASAPLYWVRDK